uniref:Uncharacterized protein n=1 Tax=Halogranum amylolyticum TaxID=660520 RepID=A0A1H8RTU0_9EURY|nr:hypothetical protein SAMN04487948_104229 [Halogranum amylolyticum]
MFRETASNAADFGRRPAAASRLRHRSQSRLRNVTTTSGETAPEVTTIGYAEARIAASFKNISTKDEV